jgi:AraC-like DNA-binding protein
MNNENTFPRLSFAELPSPIYFQLDEFNIHDRVVNHRHPWGQLNYSASGVMELNIGGQYYLAPPQYALWIPSEIEHGTYTLQSGRHHAIYISTTLCHRLPSAPCALTLSPILTAILEDFATRKLNRAHSDADHRLTEVLLDQLQLARCLDSYLPTSPDPTLSKLINKLQQAPGSTCPLSAWAECLHMTERTLARRFQHELCMSFIEWRQRLRFLAAIPMLAGGKSVQNIALELGYSTSSTFIRMFRRQANCTPEQYRRQASNKR